MVENRQPNQSPKRGFKRWEKAGIRIQSAGELYDAAFGLYRQSGFELLRLIFIPATISFGLIALALRTVLPNLFSTNNPDSIWQQASEVAFLMMISILCVAPVVLVAYSYMTSCISLYVADIHLGRRPNLVAIQRSVWKRLGTLVAINFLVLLKVLLIPVVSVGLLLLSALMDVQTGSSDSYVPFISLLGVLGIVVGMITVPIAFSWSSIEPVVAIQESCSAKQARKRSKELLKPLGPTGRGTAVGLLFVTLLLQLLLYGAFSIPAELFRDFMISNGVDKSNLLLISLFEFLNIFGAYTSFLLVHPILISGLTLIYFDRRILVDGFDIELLAKDVWRNDRAISFDI